MGEKFSQKQHNWVLTSQASSVGNIDANYLRDILSSFIPGFATIDELKQFKSQKKKQSSEFEIQNIYKMIYPTDDYITNECEDGPNRAAPLIFNKSYYEKKTFPSQSLHKFEAPEHFIYHHGIIPHLKLNIVTRENMKIDDDSIIYIGSHNFTPSAWGRYEKEYSQISIQNTELGILIPPGKNSFSKKKQIIESCSFKFPPSKYDKFDKPYTRDFAKF